MSIVRKIIGFFLQAISVAAAIYSAAMVIAAFTTMATAMIVFFGGGVAATVIVYAIMGILGLVCAAGAALLAMISIGFIIGLVIMLMAMCSGKFSKAANEAAGVEIEPAPVAA